MHEFVLSGAPMKRNLGIKTLDLAKRLLDHGYHPPTVYFPLLVDEALMVEPTETETKETLDGFAEAVEQILAEAAEDPTIAQNAPYSTPVRRLDEVQGDAQARRASAVGMTAGPYRPAVRHGDLLFCSGQIALDPESGEMVERGRRRRCAGAWRTSPRSAQSTGPISRGRCG